MTGLKFDSAGVGGLTRSNKATATSGALASPLFDVTEGSKTQQRRVTSESHREKQREPSNPRWDGGRVQAADSDSSPGPREPVSQKPAPWRLINLEAH